MTPLIDPWQSYWGASPLPDGITAHGIYTDTKGRTGAKLFDGRNYLLGIGGKIEPLEELKAYQADRDTRPLEPGEIVEDRLTGERYEYLGKDLDLDACRDCKGFIRYTAPGGVRRP